MLTIFSNYLSNYLLTGNIFILLDDLSVLRLLTQYREKVKQWQRGRCGNTSLKWKVIALSCPTSLYISIFFLLLKNHMRWRWLESGISPQRRDHEVEVVNATKAFPSLFSKADYIYDNKYCFWYSAIESEYTWIYDYILLSIVSCTVDAYWVHFMVRCQWFDYTDVGMYLLVMFLLVLGIWFVNFINDSSYPLKFQIIVLKYETRNINRMSAFALQLNSLIYQNSLYVHYYGSCFYLIAYIRIMFFCWFECLSTSSCCMTRWWCSVMLSTWL